MQVLMAAGVWAQSPSGSAAPTPVVASSATVVAAAAEADNLSRRMERARALAAAHQLVAAAAELESLRGSVKDEVVRNNSSLMLMGIYLEDGNYARAEALLEETFKARAIKSEASARTYFALAGQAVNGARAHVGRYRTFGIDVTSTNLPAEAVTDLDRLRSLLERMSAQGKELVRENAKANDAFALLEDITGIRAALARDSVDRLKWDSERSAARARLATLPADNDTSATAPNVNTEPAGSEPKSVTPVNPVPTAVPSSDQVSAGAVGNSTTSGAAPEAQPAASANLPFELGSLNERATNRVLPSYPTSARNSGISGLVRIKIVVDESGSVSNIVWAEGPLPLRQAAQEALRQWKFQPWLVDGKPVRATGYVDFGFTR